MIKGTVKLGDGRSVFVLGLSQLNMDRLCIDKPIEINVHEVDPQLPELTIWLVGGPTEDAIRDQLLAAFGQVRPQPDPDGQPGP